MKTLHSLTRDLLQLLTPYPHRFRAVRIASVMVLAASPLQAVELPGNTIASSFPSPAQELHPQVQRPFDTGVERLCFRYTPGPVALA